MKSITLSLSFVLIIFFTACSDENNPGGPACATGFNFIAELSTETEALNTALSTYASNPSTENCIAYAAAAQTYIDTAATFEECANLAGQGEELIEAITNAQTSLDALVC